jgi:tRNA A37 threonylcarbamoyladenosine modification protein TsaB
MADVLGIEVAGVCSLDILARQSSLTLPVAVATDARRKEIYWALYDGPAADGSRRRLEGPAVDRPADVAHVLAGLPVIGRGAVLYAEALGVVDPAEVVEYPSAEVLALGVATGTLPVVAPDPLYLRRPDVTMSSGPKSVLPK